MFDQETGPPLAQYDSRPRGGAYPLRFWWPGDRVDDRVTISLAGVPPGEYGIAIGVYDPHSGVRLPLLDQDGEPLVQDGRYLLPQLVVVE